MSLGVAPAAAVTLRCHFCSHMVATSNVVMRLVGIFKPSLVGRVGRAHTQELRRRCASCGWVNVFHPDTRREVIEVK